MDHVQHAKIHRSRRKLAVNKQTAEIPDWVETKNKK